MASIAFDSSDTRDASKPPISLHPAFPAVVALWFAALLGLGSMVLPVSLIERAVEITGLSALVPAASPPLGFTARSLIALVSAIAGATIGIAIARRIAGAHDADRPSRVAKFAKGARRPIDVNEELGGEGLVNGFGLPISRRRALAIAEDDRPSDFLYMAPLPGQDADDQTSAFERPAVPAADDEPFELSDAVEDAAEAAGPGAWDHPDEDSPITVVQEFQPLAPEPGEQPRQEFMPEPTRAGAEPLPFSPPSLARRPLEAEPLALEPEPAPAVPEAYKPELREPLEFDPAPTPPEPEPFRGDWSSAPLEELGLVQLVQRLGASLERRRELLAAAAAAAPAPVLAPAAGFEPAPAEEAAQAMAAYFGKPSEDALAAADSDDADAIDAEPPAPFAPMTLRSRPTLLGAWPAAHDEDDADTDAMPSFTLPLRTTIAPTIAFDTPEAPQNDDEVPETEAKEPDASYSSLLEMRSPFTPKDNGFVRIDEPEADDDGVEPAVIFPGHGESASAASIADQSASRAFDRPDGSSAPMHAPAAPANADAALRAALATLQRMSGNA